MTLRMGDGPVANIPAGLDAVAGYVDEGGIGITFPQVVSRFPAAHHLSVSIHGAPAMCGDVENGALTTWKGYDVGYCSLGTVGNAVRNAGRPRKLWVGHYTDTAHICTQQACDPTLHLTALAGWHADGTQWTTHNDVWDESLLADDFFAASPTPTPAPPAPAHREEPSMFVAVSAGPTSGPPQPVIAPGTHYLVFGNAHKYIIETGTVLSALQAKLGPAVPLDCSFLANIPDM